MAKLYQLELDQTAVNCGMSYVFQLEDSSFLLIDGGYFTPGEEDRLYDFLCEKSRGCPLIRAWFFTHGHQDHVGNFIQFIGKYRDRVEIELLLYNFQPVDFSTVDGDWKSSDPATVQEFYRTVDEWLPGVGRKVPRTGDVYRCGEITLEVVYTHEDPYPERRFFNDCSTVVRTTVGGCRILWLADVGGKAADVLLQTPEAIKCDIVQVAHHGIDNFPNHCDLYAATGASVVLWPTPDYGMVQRKNNPVNHFLLHDLNVREHFVSGYGTVELSLPYVPGTARKKRKYLTLDRQPDPADGFEHAGGGMAAFRYLTPLAVDPADDGRAPDL